MGCSEQWIRFKCQLVDQHRWFLFDIRKNVTQYLRCFKAWWLGNLKNCTESFNNPWWKNSLYFHCVQYTRRRLFRRLQTQCLLLNTMGPCHSINTLHSSATELYTTASSKTQHENLEAQLTGMTSLKTYSRPKYISKIITKTAHDI